MASIADCVPGPRGFRFTRGETWSLRYSGAMTQPLPEPYQPLPATPDGPGPLERLESWVSDTFLPEFTRLQAMYDTCHTKMDVAAIGFRAQALQHQIALHLPEAKRLLTLELAAQHTAVRDAAEAGTRVDNERRASADEIRAQVHANVATLQKTVDVLQHARDALSGDVSLSQSTMRSVREEEFAELQGQQGAPALYETQS